MLFLNDYYLKLFRFVWPCLAGVLERCAVSANASNSSGANALVNTTIQKEPAVLHLIALLVVTLVEHNTTTGSPSASPTSSGASTTRGGKRGSSSGNSRGSGSQAAASAAKGRTRYRRDGFAMLASRAPSLLALFDSPIDLVRSGAQHLALALVLHADAAEARTLQWEALLRCVFFSLISYN